MGTFVYLICVAVASFAVLAQPAVAQGTNTKVLHAYPGQVLQGDGSQTCHSEGQRERVRNEVDTATLSLLQESIVPLLHNFSCGGSTGWRRVAYLDMSNPSQRCPSVWQEITTPFRVCGRKSRSGGIAVRDYFTPLVVCGITRCVVGSLATRGGLQGLSIMLLVDRLTVSTTLMESVSHVASPANTSGPSLLVLMNKPFTLVNCAPVSLGALVEAAFPHLWARTTSVRQAGLVALAMVFFIQMVIPCGMDRGVVPLAPVAPSIHHHGSK